MSLRRGKETARAVEAVPSFFVKTLLFRKVLLGVLATSDKVSMYVYLRGSMLVHENRDYFQHQPQPTVEKSRQLSKAPMDASKQHQLVFFFIPSIVLLSRI